VPTYSPSQQDIGAGGGGADIFKVRQHFTFGYKSATQLSREYSRVV
jgi:hypothetical protein